MIRSCGYVLVVGYELSLGTLMCQLLEEELGLSAAVAPGYLEARALIMRRRPTVLVQDIRMPGTSVEQCMSFARELQAGGARLVISSTDHTAAPAIAEQLSAEAYVAQPFDIADFIAAVQDPARAPGHRRWFCRHTHSKQSFRMHSLAKSARSR